MADEFLTPLQEGANGLHELYSSYITAGFTVEQAFALTQQALEHGMGNNK